MELGSGAQLRQHALKIIADIRNCTESSRKRELVKELTDLDVGRVPLCVEDILHEVVALQHNNETIDVKKGLLYFLKKILWISMDWEVLSRTIDWLKGMLNGREIPVVLGVIQACPKLTQNIFTQALEKGSDPNSSPGWQEAWSKNVALLCSSIDIALDGPDGAIIMYTAKLVEQCVLTLTNPSDTGLERHSQIPSNHPVFNAGRLHSISQTLVQRLITMCKPELSLRGTSLIVIIKALGSIARLRAAFTGRIVPALLEMVTSGKFQVASKYRGVSDADGVMVSIGTALKEALVGALKNHDPTARVWRKRLVEGLKHLGAVQTAEQTVKQLDRQAEKERRAHKLEKQVQSQAKRIKTDKTHMQVEPPVIDLSLDVDEKSPLEEKPEDQLQNTGPPSITQRDSSEMIKSSLVPQKNVLAAINPTVVEIEGGQRTRDKGSKNGVSASGQALSKPEENPLLNKRLDVTQVRAILGLLASIGQKKLLQGFVKNLDVRILADVVIANLKDLTPRAEIATEEDSPSSRSPPGSPISPALISEDNRSEEDIPLVSIFSGGDHTAVDESEMKGDPSLHDSTSEASSMLHAPSVESDDPFVRSTKPASFDNEDAGTQDIQAENQPREGSSYDLVTNGHSEATSEQDVAKEEEGDDDEGDDKVVDMEPDIRIKGIEVIEKVEHVKKEPAEDILMKDEVTNLTEDIPTKDEATILAEDTGDQMNIDSVEDWGQGEEEEDEEDKKDEMSEMQNPDSLEENNETMDGVQRLALRPRALTTEQSECLMEQGISPLIHANVASNRHATFSQGVLAKLAAVGSIEKGPGELVLNHIVKTFPDKVYVSRTAQELAIKWLFSIFLDHGAPAPSEGVDTDQDMESSFQGGLACENSAPSKLNTRVGHYEEALSALLKRLSTKIEDPRDKSITSFLLDVPALPVNPVCSFLKELSSRGSLFATLSLMTASKLMEERPPLQRTMLYLVLELTTAIDEDTREKAIRLVKNKLHSAMEFAGEIEAFAVQSLHKLKDVKQEDKDLENGEDDFVIEETEDAEEDWERFCSLYMALCTRNKSLLRGLMEVYGATNDQGQKAISGNAPKLADAIGYNSTELLELIRDTPEGASELLLLMLTVMPKRVPSPAVVQACQERFKAKDDVRFVVPALPGLAKRDALEMVPLLARLPIKEFSAAVLALIARPRLDESIEPSEVLVALNRAKMSEQGVKLVQLRSALDHCLRRLSEVFDREALAGALNKMVQLPSLPMLFMRMVLLSVVRERSLCAFVLGTLLTSSVVIDKIMNQKNQWRGYLMLMAQTVPWSYKHLLELPTQVMKSVLKESSQEYVTKFRRFVESSECDIRIPAETMTALMDSAEVIADDQAGVSVSGGSSPQTVKESTCSAAGETAVSNEESVANPGENNVGT